jgi:ADP-heptose:LPS heptosyltransferase
VNKQTTMLMLATGAPVRVGLGGRRNDRVYSLPVHLPVIRHWVDAYIALGQPFGIREDSRDWRARLVIPDADRGEAERAWTSVSPRRPRIVVNPFSASADRQWPLDRFGPVIAHLRHRLPHAAVIVPLMPSGHPEMEGVAASAGATPMRLTLPQVSALTATSDLVISPDTSITVIASAFRIPVLALMRKDTGQWVPYRNDGRVAFSDDPRSLNGLPVERVIAEADAIIDEMGAVRGWR